MNWLAQLLSESWNILAESATFILVGFVIAAVLHVLMSRGNWAKWMQGLGAKSVLLASAIGLPLPLCSCSVLPAAVSLRKNGASKGATLSFLISTPETSVQSVALTYALLGPVMAIFRPLASCITAVLAGLTENFLEKRYPSEPAPAAAAESGEDVAHDCCHGPATEVVEESDPCCDHEHDHNVAEHASVRSGFRHAFIDVFDDVVGWMLIGIVVAAIIQVAVPGFIIQAVFGPPLQAMLIMLVIGVPLYVCAEASTPIAAALIIQGVSPGAALVFLLAGPATNIGAVGLLYRQLGKRTVIIYLTTIAIVSVTLGFALDWFFGASGASLADRALSEPLLPRWLKTLGALVFLVLCVASARRLHAYTKFANFLDRWAPMHVTTARLSTLLVVLLVGGYFASGLVVIQPGEVGMIKRFGAVVEANAEPGLHYAWPIPIGSVDRVKTRAVHRLVLGDEQNSASANASDLTEVDDRAWVLLGDENIANIKCAAHWRMAPDQTRAFAYASADRELLVSNAVRAALREVLGSANIDTVFTTDQQRLALAVQRETQHMLDTCDSGIEIADFHFLDLHAPPQVHEAFRDVASALEDKATRRNQALTRKAEIEPLARGDRDKLIRGASADALRKVAVATGEADAFTEKRAAYHEYPEMSRVRMLLEMYDRVLPGTRKCIRPSNANLDLDLRFNKEKPNTIPEF